MSAGSKTMTDRTLASGRRHLVTPEGIDLQIELADVGARIGAFAIDLIIIILTLIAAAFSLGTVAGLGSEASEAILILIAFFLRSF